MDKYAGVTLDHYDDRGETLKVKFPTIEQLPDVIKTANVIPKEQLPNEAFALIAVDGPNVLRKYACHDAGNTAISAIYFMEHAHKLPEPAVKMAATNLMNACANFGLLPPLELTKQASAGMDDAELERQRLHAEHEARESPEFEAKEQLTGVEDEPEALERPMQTPAQALEQAIAQATEGLPPGFSLHGKVNNPGGMPPTDDDYAINRGMGMPPTAGAPDDPMTVLAVDITGMSARPKFASTRPKDDGDYAYVGSDGTRLYPIDTWQNVKQASDYWLENQQNMEPPLRRQFAVKLAAKADHLGFPINEKIKQAGATTWASDEWVKTASEMRKVAAQLGPKESKELDDLFSVRSHMSAEKYAQSLREFDVKYGLDRRWDSSIPDPYASTFALQKSAEVVWEEGVDRVTAAELHNLAMNHSNTLSQLYFSQSLLDGFEKDPVGIFNSLPLPQKRRLSRLANDLSNQGRSEGQVPLTAGDGVDQKRKEGSVRQIGTR